VPYKPHNALCPTCHSTITWKADPDEHHPDIVECPGCGLRWETSTKTWQEGAWRVALIKPHPLEWSGGTPG
jgi:Zn ribbon nucleic-acid-binding protein